MRLFNEDCFTVFKKLESEGIRVDMVLCDMPYSINKKKGFTSNYWDLPIPLEDMWSNLFRLTKDNAVYAFTAGQPFTSKLVMSNLEMFKHEWIWKKNRGSNFANTIREPMKEHESVIIFSNGKWVYNKQMEERAESGKARANYDVEHTSKSSNYREFEGRKAHKISAMRVPSSVQKFNVEVGLHPTQKPVALMEYLIKTYTNEGDLVLDFCMGSGTTGVACRNLNRNFIGIEKDSRYFEIARTRIEGVKVRQTTLKIIKRSKV